MNNNEEYNLLLEKIAEIRELFDDSDVKAEGHGMEDMICDPFAVLIYAKNKMERLMDENNWLYGKLNQVSYIIESGRNEIARF